MIGVVFALGAILAIAIVAADAYWRRAHALDGLQDPRVLRAMRERVRTAHEQLRANRANG